MEIKEFFDSNFSNILKDHSCPDHETAFKDVKERAKRMKNKESDVRQIQFKEVPVDYTEPKKSTKVLHAVAGVAGAAAVLTGAVFGIKFLNEHGGLKEGGSDEIRAGYNEDTKTMSDVMESKDILDAVGDVIEFEDMTATIEQVLYDGHILRVIYRVDSYDENYYGDGPAGAIMLLDEKRVINGENYFRSSGGGTYDKYLDKTEHRNVIFLRSELLEGQSTELTFMHNVRQSNEEESTESPARYYGSYTLNGIDSSKNSYIIYENNTVPMELHTDGYDKREEAEMVSVALTPLGAVIAETDCMHLYRSFDIKYRDGSVVNILDINDDGVLQPGGNGLESSGYYEIISGDPTVPKECLGLNTDIESGTHWVYIYSMQYDRIDVNNIASITINGKETLLNICAGMDIEAAKELLMKKGIGYEVSEEENADIPVGCVIRTEPEIGLLEEAPDKVTVYVSAKKNILDAANNVIEFDGLTATIEKVDFDGTFLRVYYTPSDYDGDSPRALSAIVMLSTSDPTAHSEKFFSGKGGAYDEVTGLSCTSAFVDLDEGETLDIDFKNGTDEKAGHYILTGIDKSENTYTYDINDNGIKWIRLSPFGAVIASSENYTRDPHCSFTVVFGDGSTRKIYGDSSSAAFAGGSSGEPIEEHFGLESGDIVTTFLSIDPDPIDVDNVAAVILNGEEIRFEEDSQDNSKTDDAASDEVVDFLANIEQLVNSSEQIEELKQLLLKIEGVADVQVYNSDDDSKNTEIQITEGNVEKGMVVKVFYDNGESWVQYTKQ